MGNISLKKDEIVSAISSINSLTDELNDEFLTICNSVDKIKGVWSDDIGLYDRVSSILNSIRSINKGYLEFSNEYVKVLQDMVDNYEQVDQNLTAKVAGAATMTLGAGAFSNFDFSKLTDRATKVTDGTFLDEGNIHKEVFTDGEYTINYLDENTARIDKNGVPIYFTTKENVDKLASGSNATSSNAIPLVGNTNGELSVEQKDALASSKPVKPDVLYTYDKSGRVSLTTLHPDVEVMKNQLIDECARQGLQIKVTETVRSVGRQDSLYAQGRTAPGSKVTNAKGSSYSSNHQWGIAFDVCMADGDTWNKENLAKVGQIGKDIGLEWGGDWKMVDMPHFQLPDYGSGTKEIKAMYGTPDKFAETWYQDE